jgi:hypothetical protein
MTKDQVQQKHSAARGKACPNCQAQPGQPCVATKWNRGHPMKTHHHGRYVAAEQGVQPVNPEPATLSDEDALDLIRDELSGVIWTPDSLDAIAAYIRGTGREVLPPADDEPQFSTSVKPVLSPELRSDWGRR